MGQNINESYYKKPDDDLIKEITDKIPLPYIKELGYYGITEESQIEDILSYIFGKELKRTKNTGHWFTLTDEENRVIYTEIINRGLRNYPLGTWIVYKYEDDRFPKKWTKQIISSGDITTKEYSEGGDVESTTYGEIEKIPKRITESVDEDSNKRYLDNVLNHLISGTKFYEKKIRFPFLPHIFLIEYYFSENVTPSSYLMEPFYEYSRIQFGLTDEETEYIYLKFTDIIYNRVLHYTLEKY